MPVSPHRTPLAWLTLTHQKGRLVLSIAGIGLAVILMSTQFGFRNAMYDSQINLIKHLETDLVMISKMKELIYAPVPFARSRLQQALAFDDVAEAHPFYMEIDRSFCKNPEDQTTRPIRVRSSSP